MEITEITIVQFEIGVKPCCLAFEREPPDFRQLNTDETDVTYTYEIQ
jgi:hypothetical protein